MEKIVLILFLLITNTLYSQNFPIDGGYHFQEDFGIENFQIENEYIKFWKDGKDSDKLVYKYNLMYTDGLPFLTLSDEISDNTSLYDNLLLNKKFLFLMGLKSNNAKILFGYTRDYNFGKRTCIRTRFTELGGTCYDCSSFLVEKVKDYPVSNLSTIELETPWVEGVSGYGIGEYFSLKRSDDPYILIMNGYISYDKPYLYQQNSRVKKLRIVGKRTKKEIICEVLDTPHPQTLDISSLKEKEDLQIFIYDVYPGSKYEDTCIHFILPWDEQIIPWENEIK